MPSLDIIIVNWNARDQLRRCLGSIAACARGDIVLNRVVVVDNGSTDDSISGISGFDLPLTLIANPENRGFAVACNQGAADSTADYFLFLNPDTRLDPDSLTTPVRFMQEPQNSGYGIVGIQLVGEDGTVSRTCARLPTPGQILVRLLGLNHLAPGFFPNQLMEEWDHQRSMEVDHVMGAFYLVRAEVFHRLRGFDERFFVYYEDVDFSCRAARLGWRSYYLTAARAYHRGGGTSYQVKPIRLFYSLRSRILYAFKHFGTGAAMLVALATLAVEPVTRLGLAILQRSPETMRDTMSGYRLLWRSAPSILAKGFRRL
ncbi:MAG: glycosyltransferase family 2 protein [Thalassobaculales bacterium]